MSYGYMAAYVLVALILTLCALSARKSEKAIAATVSKLLHVAIAAVVVNIVALFSGNRTVSTLAYGIMFAIYDWVIYFMLKFSLEYIGERIEKHVKLKLMWLLLAADGIQMIANTIYGHAFTCEEYVFKDGAVGYRFTPELFYYVHLVLAYMLVIFCFITLIYKICVVPVFYSGQYISMVVAAAIVVIANLAYLRLEEGIYISVMFFALEGVIIYYYSLIHSSVYLLNRMHSLLVEGMEDSLVLFGLDGKCENINRMAEKFFGIPKGQLEGHQQTIYDWCEKNEITLYANSTREIVEKDSGGERYYKVQCRRLEDRNRRYLGSYLVIHDQTDAVNQYKEEQYLMSHDRLTGLYNKEYFYAVAAKILKSNSKEEYYIVCSDIKNFKIVNDIYGNQAGDELLIKVSEVLRTWSADGEVYGRLDNDRFGMLMKKKSFDEEKILKLLQDAIYIDVDEYFSVNMYLGIYEVEDRSLPVSGMCDRAQMALGTVKGNYEKKIAFYDRALRDNLLSEQKLAREAEIALEEEQFLIYLQPQIDTQGRVLGGEALVRWQHPEQGLIMPGKFIGVMEKNGMIAKLDYYIWELACRQLRAWKDKGREDMYISVNISPKDFYFLNVYDSFMKLVEKYDINPHNLKLEITETAVMNNLDKQLKLIDRLRGVGFVMEMDDFGSGYSSLNMLKDIKMDMLKVDMAFLGQTDNEERARTILKIIIELAKQLNMPAIVEGVETDEQVEFLKKVGCDIFQGYYFAKPMDIPTFEKMYMSE